MGRIGIPEVMLVILAVGLPYWVWRGFPLTKRRSVYVVVGVLVLFFVYQFTQTLTPALPH
jgi:hypothetical protein